MYNPLENVPLNTNSVYVMATTINGCEVYMPVDVKRVGNTITKEQEEIISKRKQELQDYLYWKDEPIFPEAA